MIDLIKLKPTKQTNLSIPNSVLFVLFLFLDVDTPEPDEKSLITYISSLYDVFPNPPALHPLYDPVSASYSFVFFSSSIHVALD